MIGWCTHSAFAQNFEDGVRVPLWQCYRRCPQFHDDDEGCCTPNWINAECRRIDSAPVVIFPGVTTVIPGPNFDFYCENCCKYDPDECPGNDVNPAVRHCELQPAYSFTETISKSISSAITASIEIVHAKLEAGVGVSASQARSVTLTCTLDAPKCRAVRSQPRITYRAAQRVRVDHWWIARGTWGTVPQPWCEGHPCSVAGLIWEIPSQYCGMTQSFATGNVLVSAGCGSPQEYACPPRSPCR